MTLALKLYNTLTRQKAEFQPIDPKNVRMYVCGPTVYDFAHIGNARPVIVFDVLYRLLRHIYGPEHVTYVRNITDVDDKINARAAERYPELAPEIGIRKLTDDTTAQFHKDIAALGVLPPNVEPRATEHIVEMVQLCEALVANGHAYVAADHVLFDVAAMPDYGRLSNRSLDEMEAGARVEVAPYKKGPMDFVLWKPSKPGEPGWPSPAGITVPGRPGWHIECSAMAGKHLGNVFDIHGGGIDLTFPHHENEIAQSRCAHGTPVMANVWMHNGFLQVEGEKMSKSLGNFVTINELLTQCVGDVIRHLMIQTHYRQPIDWTQNGLASSQLELLSWSEFISERCGEVAEPAIAGGACDADLISVLQDDLNSPAALTRLRELFGLAKAGKLSWQDFLANARFLGFKNLHRPGFFHPHIMGNVFESGPQPNLQDQRLFLQYRSAIANGDVSLAETSLQATRLRGFRLKINEEGVVFVGNLTSAEFSDLQIETNREINSRIARRSAARKAKDFKESDRIRDELAAMGIALKDTKNKDTGEIETTWEVMR
ncbi:MAG: cysteine--tRNA ligase [Hyphomicrobium sp.]|nr:MAG: cysteine--tRNA ligase [Hyphomicrobium sp.]PPC99776.1 MAG: cysteine--tRNA ligase [Hyphomicrobium sp.]